MKLEFCILVLTLITGIGDGIPQSNYGVQGNVVEYNMDQKLPGTVTLAGKVTEFDDLKPQIILNRTTGVLNCADGSMKIDLFFKEKFYGIAYSDFDRNSACYVQGTGNIHEALELPLKGCGTKQDPIRVFTNNVIIRFHPGLEMEGDEVITIVCRYPPPIVPLPPAQLIYPPATVPAVIPAPLREFEILMIICAILFLGLTLLGLGCSYFCLKQRNIQVIRKRPFSSIEEESEKLSSIDESFTNLRIPRVHAPSTESSSDVPLEETLASDYPSSIEDAPRRPDTVSSEYSDTRARIDLEAESVPPSLLRKQQFDVNLRVARHAEVQADYSEVDDSVTSMDEASSAHASESHTEMRKHGLPQKLHEPVRSVKNIELIDSTRVVDREDVTRESRYTKPIAVRKPEVSVHTVDDVYRQTIIQRRLIEDEERRTREVTQFYTKDQPKWDVVITSHADQDDQIWEQGSETTDVASSIGWSTVEESPIRPHYSTVELEHLSRRRETTTTMNERTAISRTMEKLQESDAHIWNEKWKVLLRVLESPTRDVTEPHRPCDSDSETSSSVLTEDDREKWKQIISRESTLRNLLTQATVREDYERIRRDTRYGKLFEPEKWDVIIRVLAPPDKASDDDRLYLDSTSEVSSVVSIPDPNKPGQAIRKKSSDTIGDRKSSITGLRSMSEVMVDVATNIGMDDDSSVVSSFRGGRSIADRSQTEFVEFAPLEEEDSDSTLDDDNIRQPENFGTNEVQANILRHGVLPEYDAENSSDEASGANEFMSEEFYSRTTFKSNRLARK